MLVIFASSSDPGSPSWSSANRTLPRGPVSRIEVSPEVSTESAEMRAIHEALAIEDPVTALDALIGAACSIWDAHGYIHEQLQAIVVLEPDASAPLETHREQQRSDLQGLTRRLARADRLRPGLGETRAIATLQMLTSLESFLWLRRQDSLSLRQTRETIAELAHTLLRH